MMYMTGADLELVLLSATKRVAEKLGLTNIDFKSRTEMFVEIQQLDPTLFAQMEHFLIAYINWYYFHNELNQLGVSGNLDADTQAQLDQRIAKRDQTRKDLLKVL